MDRRILILTETGTSPKDGSIDNIVDDIYKIFSISGEAEIISKYSFSEPKKLAKFLAANQAVHVIVLFGINQFKLLDGLSLNLFINELNSAEKDKTSWQVAMEP